MYNLLIRFDDEKKLWVENSEYEIKDDRLFGYTDERIKEKYMEDLDKLKGFPCLFAYEVSNGEEEAKGHIGYIKSIRKSSYSFPYYKSDRKNITIEYELDHTYPEIYINKKDTSALEDLGIDTESWELTRTHWAVKKRNLFKFVAKSFLRRFDVEPTPTHSEMRRIWGRRLYK